MLGAATTTAVAVAAAVGTMVEAAAIDAAISTNAKAAMVAVDVVTFSGLLVPAATTASPFVRYASKVDTLQIGAGTGLRRTTSLKRSTCRRP
jgi:hypothetical protein